MLADGGTVHLRPVRPDDGDKLQDLYSRLSDESLYLRFFSPVPRPPRASSSGSRRSTTSDAWSLVAELGDDIVAVARYDRTGADEARAEVAFSGAGRPAGPRARHAAARAPRRGRARRAASGASWPTRCRATARCSACSPTPASRSRAASTRAPSKSPSTSNRRRSRSAVQRDREHTSEAARWRRMLAPRSIAVIGASRRRGDDRPRAVPQPARGRLRRPGVPGEPARRRRSPACARTRPSLDIPDAVDLAVVVVPAAAVPEVVEECARASGVHGHRDHLGRLRRGRRRGRARGARARRGRASQRHARDRARTASAS